MKRVSVTEEKAYGTALDRLTGTDKPVPTLHKKEVVEQPTTAMIKLSVFLNRQEDSYLETLASTAKFSGGKKISKTRLIENMVRAFSTTELDVRGVKTSQELFQRLTAQLRK
ncbi:hypothetical protein ACFLXU_04705 [Chloroflexota bacterium]